MFNSTFLIFSLILLIGCVPVSHQSSTPKQNVVYDNFDYTENVGIALVYPKNLSSNSYAVINSSGSNIILNFDLLENNYRNLTLSMAHCNRNWEPSSLMAVRFLDTYNEFNTINYYFSANTLVDYTNYIFDLPAPKISGNYILTVKDENSGELILSRKLIVIVKKANVTADVNQNSNINRRQNQEIDFSITYDPKLNIVPLRDFFPVILQNHIWDTQLSKLKPNLIRADEGYVEYDFFNGENIFPAGNEYRSFDISTIEFRGMNIDLVNKTPNHIQAFVSPDRPRTDLAYSQINQDLNGQFLIRNNDFNGTNDRNEYIQVMFELKKQPVTHEEIYVFGAFNNFKKNSENMMRYDQTTGSYKANLLLKQGIFDYMYVTDNANQYETIEGNFFETRNQYEVIIYYRNPLNGYDEIIGYTSISSRN
ncbi:MAG: DUF5103 domain-containing protein [Cyclobacteriaceae bacterium]